MKLLATKDPGEIAGENLPIPEDLGMYLVKSANNTSYRNYPFGQVLSQEYNSRDIKIYHYHFFADSDSYFYAAFPEPCFVLQFMTSSSVETLLQQLRSHSEPPRCGLYLMPPGNNKVKLQKGFSSSVHIELSKDYANELGNTHPGIHELLNKLLAASNKQEEPATISMDYGISYFLDRISNLPADNEVNLKMDFRVIILSLLTIYNKRLLQQEKIRHLPPMPAKGIIIEIGERILQQPDIKKFKCRKLRARYRITRNVLKTTFPLIWGSRLNEFVLTNCLENARLMLADNSISSASISKELGFKKTSRFNKAYKKHTGRKPDYFSRFK